MKFFLLYTVQEYVAQWFGVGNLLCEILTYIWFNLPVYSIGFDELSPTLRNLCHSIYSPVNSSQFIKIIIKKSKNLMSSYFFCLLIININKPVVIVTESFIFDVIIVISCLKWIFGITLWIENPNVLFVFKNEYKDRIFKILTSAPTKQRLKPSKTIKISNFIFTICFAVCYFNWMPI